MRYRYFGVINNIVDTVVDIPKTSIFKVIQEYFLVLLLVLVYMGAAVATGFIAAFSNNTKLQTLTLF
jgi:hypothetical protein